METRTTCYLNTGYNQNDTFESVDNLPDDEGFHFDNEMYVDDEEIISKIHNTGPNQQEHVYVCSPQRRYSPIGQSIRQYDSRSTLLSITPQKDYTAMIPPRTREVPKTTPKRSIKLDRRASYSVPNRKNNLDVFAPMIAQAVSNQNSAIDLRRTMSVAGISPYRETYLRRNNQSPHSFVSPSGLPVRNQQVTRSARVVSSRRRLNMNSMSCQEASQPLMRHHSLLIKSGATSPILNSTPMESSTLHLFANEEPFETSFSVKRNSIATSSACGSQYSGSSNSKSMAVISPTYRPTSRVTSTPIKMQTIVDEENDSFYKKSFSPSKEHSWIRSPRQTIPVCSLFLASSIMLLSGGASFLMAFYLIAIMGKTYYLNVGVFSGTLHMGLGMLGFRFRDWEWLPNRNYVSGFILVSLFSVVHMLGLLILIKNFMTMDFEIMDVVGGGLCCISAITILIAGFGLITSCCCKYPPPDNRVAHGVEGFTV